MRRLLLKLLRRRRLERDLEVELAFHRDMAAAGGNPTPLGNPLLLKEQARDLWSFIFWENLWRDLCYGARSLSHSPALVISALLSLGLGIGANTAVFSLAVEFLFSAPSVSDAESVISVRLGGNSHARKEALEFVRAGGVFADVVGENEEVFLNWDDGSQTRRLFAVHTTRNYFSTLGIPVAHGRGILPDDPNEVVVLADGFWRKHLGADPAVVGRAIRLDGRACTVVGILPADHRTLIGFGFSPELYVPAYRDDVVLAMYGRLKPGVSIGQARAGLATVAAQMDAHFHEPFRYADNIEVSPMAGMARLKSQRQLLTIGIFFALLLTVVGLVLLIACINVASLLLARGTVRRQEFAIRLSIGASRSRLLQQLLVESLLLALGGAACGLLIRHGLSVLLERVNLPLPLPIRLHLDLDWRITLYAAAMTTLATLASGLFPAWQSVRQSIAPGLRREGRLRLRRRLVAAQIALSVVVLAAGFVFLRNLWLSTSISPGFDVRNTLRAEAHLEPAAYKSSERKRAYVAEALQALAGLPGIEEVAAAEIVPFTDSKRRSGEIELRDTNETIHADFQWNAVSPQFFRVMSIPVLRGRSFLSSDRDPSTRVVVVNRTFVQRYLGKLDPIGLEFRWSDRVRYTIVGVVEGTRNLTIGEEDRPQFYEHLAQIESDRTRLQFVLKSVTPPATQLDAVRQALRRVDAGTGLEVATLYSSIGLAFFPSQAGAALFGSLGLLGLTLAMVGLYGVMVYSVARRTREIGVRLAVGARTSDIRRMVLAEAARLIGAGCLTGLAVAVLVVRPLAMFLVPGLRATDPMSFGLVLLVLAVTGAAAAWGPARRAARQDPMTSLRYE